MSKVPRLANENILTVKGGKPAVECQDRIRSTSSQDPESMLQQSLITV